MFSHEKLQGCNKTGTIDKKRFYEIARGSTFECAAILDAIKILQLIEESKLEAAKKVLEEVAAMLSSLCLKWEQKGDGAVQVHVQAKG